MTRASFGLAVVRACDSSLRVQSPVALASSVRACEPLRSVTSTSQHSPVVPAERTRRHALERRAFDGRVGDRERVRLPAAMQTRGARHPEPDVLARAPPRRQLVRLDHDRPPWEAGNRRRAKARLGEAAEEVNAVDDQDKDRVRAGQVWDVKVERDDEADPPCDMRHEEDLVEAVAKPRDARDEDEAAASRSSVSRRRRIGAREEETHDAMVQMRPEKCTGFVTSSGATRRKKSVCSRPPRIVRRPARRCR